MSTSYKTKGMDGLYKVCQNQCGIKPGMKVKVTREAQDGEMGWPNCWAEDMCSFVGEEHTVEHLDIRGVYLGGYSFPYFVLEIVE